ncbi:MAG: prepilin-type N-terminal cleavage/methylation domain-containing protein [Gammaproteobacteria bacterium]|jgi:prepilin-type N-terminal cleavage/methylation domain-containing protein|nr:prepilin-type N-terminal cleavage/methylation domain-containing protein [Gammaproteobacteria bacterium]MBT7308388.1 prepilin-type N-terminal cleavage/methylation domain-containing protein [Gammaproteobacteria bacterium]
MIALTGGSKRQQGFTLIEVMTASSIGMVLMLVVLTLMHKAGDVADRVRSTVLLNTEIRLLMEGVNEGRLSTHQQPVAKIENRIMGFHGRAAAETGPFWEPDLAAKKYRLFVKYPLGSDYDADPDNNPKLLSSQLSPITLPCRGADLPYPGCTTGASVSGVEGYLSAVALNTVRTITDPSGKGRTIESVITLVDPYRAARDTFAEWEYRQSFRSIHALNVDG